MWFLPKRTKNPNPMPKWMFWGLAIFIFIMFYVNSTSPSKHVASPMQQTVQKITADLPEISTYQQAMPEQIKVRSYQVQAGNQVSLLCGQQVEIHYKALDEEKNLVAEDTLKLTYGDAANPAIVTRLLQGMHIGEVRQMTFDPGESLARIVPGGEDKNIIIFEMTLNAAEPDFSGLFSADRAPLLLQDDKLAKPPLAACGDEIKFSATIWNAEGKEIFRTTSPLAVTIGRKQIMLGLEQGLIGMGIGGTRHIVLPPAWQKNAPPSDMPAVLSGSTNQTLIFDVTRTE